MAKCHPGTSRRTQVPTPQSPGQGRAQQPTHTCFSVGRFSGGTWAAAAVAGSWACGKWATCGSSSSCDCGPPSGRPSWPSAPSPLPLSSEAQLRQRLSQHNQDLHNALPHLPHRAVDSPSHSSTNRTHAPSPSQDLPKAPKGIKFPPSPRNKPGSHLTSGLRNSFSPQSPHTPFTLRVLGPPLLHTNGAAPPLQAPPRVRGPAWRRNPPAPPAPLSPASPRTPAHRGPPQHGPPPPRSPGPAALTLLLGLGRHAGRAGAERGRPPRRARAYSAKSRETSRRHGNSRGAAGHAGNGSAGRLPPARMRKCAPAPRASWEL